MGPLDAVPLLMLALLAGVTLPCVLCQSQGAKGYNLLEVYDSSTCDRFPAHESRAVERLLRAKGGSRTLEDAAAVARDECREAEEDIRSDSSPTCTFGQLPKAAARCDRLSFHLLTAAYIGAFDDKQLDDGSLVRKFVVEAYERHGKLCRPNYMRRFDELSSKQEYQDAKLEIDRRFSRRDIDKIFSTPYYQKGSLDSASDRIRAEGILWRALHVMGGEWKKEATYGLDDFYYNYLKKPCRAYYGQLADIFLPARMDLTLDSGKLGEINPDNRDDFTDAWLKFRVCHSLLYPDQKVITFSIGNSK